MLSFFKFLCVLIVFDLGGAVALGSSLAPEVQSFVSQHRAEDPALLSVLVQYRAPVSEPSMAYGFYSRAQVMTSLVQRNKNLQDQVLANISQPGSVQNIWITRGSFARLTSKEIQKIQSHPMVSSIQSLGRRAHILKDGARHRGTHDADYTYGLSKIRLPDLRAAQPDRDGRGIRVGVLDTGVAASVPALGGRVILFKDFVGGQTTAYDDHGHGTHVSGTIAGGILDGEYIGVAMGANLIEGKVFDKYGGFDDKTLLLGMQWMADPDGDPTTDDAPHIVSNSWIVEAKASDEDQTAEPFCQAVDTWVHLGIIPVFAAGNDGPDASSIGIPAACANAIAVANTNEDDDIDDSSSRGPANWKSASLNKPEISAPGTDIDSAAPDGGNANMTGTSMAAPHVAGSLALLLQGLTRQDDTKAVQALFQGADKLNSGNGAGFDFTFGNGRVNLLQSVGLLK